MNENIMNENNKDEYTDEEFDEYVYQHLKSSEEREERGEVIWLNRAQVFDALREELNLVD